MFLKKFLTFVSSTFVARILCAVRDIIFAGTFGASFISDAFWFCFRTTSFLKFLCAEWTIYGTLVPEISGKLKENKQEEAEQIFSSFFAYIGFMVIGLVVLVEIFTPFVVDMLAPGYQSNPEQRKLAIDLMRIIFPLILCYSASSIFVSVQNALQIFWVQPSMRLIFDSGTVIAIMIAHHYYDSLSGIYCLALGVILSGIVQTIFLYFLAHIKKFKITFKKLINMRYLISRMFKTSLASLGLYMNTFVDLCFASYLPYGQLTYLACAERINLLVIDALGVSIGSIVLVNFATIKDDPQKLKDLLEDALIITLQFTLLASAVLILASDMIVKLFFNYGKFDLNDCYHTSKAFIFYGLGIPAFSLIRVMSSFFFSLNKQNVAILSSAASIIINLIGNASLIGKFGYMGMAFATTVSLWTSVGIFLWHLRKELSCLKEVIITCVWVLTHAALAYFLIKHVFFLEESLGFFKDLTRVLILITIISCSYFGFGRRFEIMRLGRTKIIDQL